jgi:hypothetical protein
VDPGILRSSAISRKIATGSHVVRSTPSKALREASARLGRPPFGFDFLEVVAGSSAIDHPFISRCNTTSEGFLAFDGARAHALYEGRGGRGEERFQNPSLRPVKLVGLHPLQLRYTCARDMHVVDRHRNKPWSRIAAADMVCRTVHTA